MNYYTAKDYNKLLGMEGFSDALLKNHFALYQGYVTNTNKLIETLSQLIRRETGFVIKKRILRYDGLPITPQYILHYL